MKTLPGLTTNPFLKDKFNIIVWLCIILAILVTTGIVYLKFEPQVESINLQHNIYFGISKIGAWWKVFFYPLYGLIIALANFIIAYFIYKKEPTAARVLAILCLLCQLIIGVQVFIVILLNVSQ